MWKNHLFRIKHLCALLALCVSCELWAQQSEVSVKLYFDQGSDLVVDSYNLRDLSALVDSLRASITHISIEGYSSPEGGELRNERLSQLRAEAVRSYLVYEKGVADSLISIVAGGVAWSRMQRLVECQRQEYAQAVLQILEREPASVRTSKLRALDGGAVYYKIFESLYPLLRYADVTIYNQYQLPQLKPVVVPTVHLAEVQQVAEVAEVIEVVEVAEVVELPQVGTPIAAAPLFALKTNLLFDLATLINIELEIPIGQRWSVAAEYIFPWWVFDNHRANSARSRIQLLNGNLEARRWWGERESRAVLTGWFTGLYAGVGSYDFEHDAKGYQGEFFLAAGLSGGYAHTINRAQTLRMEYCLGVGYLETDYRHYHAEYCVNDIWHAIEQSSGRYSWFGPTRARVSLSWLINGKAKK